MSPDNTYIDANAKFLGCYLEVAVDALKKLGIVCQLVTDVFRVGEDALQVSPGALHSQPGANHQVCQHQTPLPAAHLHQEVLHVLAHQDILQLNLHMHTQVYPQRLQHQHQMQVVNCFLHQFLTSSRQI